MYVNFLYLNTIQFYNTDSTPRLHSAPLHSAFYPMPYTYIVLKEGGGGYMVLF